MIKEDLVQKVDVLALGDAADTGGIGSLAANLEGLPGITGFRNIKSIGLFLGNDSNPKKKHFQMLNQSGKQISEDKNSTLYNMISIPITPYTKETTVGHVSISTFFSPGPMRTGCLETLILEVLSELYDTEMGCIDELVPYSSIS